MHSFKKKIKAASLVPGRFFLWCMLPMVLCLFSTPASAVTQFRNFSDTLGLVPTGNGCYLLDGTIGVKLTNRIIILTDADVTKAQILNTDKRVTRVTELYRLACGIYFSVAFGDQNDLNAILACFTAQPFVQLVQPDLLQLREKSTQAVTRHGTEAYLDRLKISPLWKSNKGANVKIAIIDDGFDLTHEDLQGVRLAFGYDMESETFDPSPRNAMDTHGTRVAGVIFARHNGVGIDGIAPEADLIAIRHADTWTSRTVLSFYLAKLAGADIVNCSWNSKVLLQPVADAINDLTTRGRGKKGVAVVFAAGNKGRELEKNASEAALPDVITVGAADRNGHPLKFSNYGKAVDVYAWGKNVPATTTGDKKYGIFSGTSASASIVSGIVALLLSQDQDISLREINQKLGHALLQKWKVGNEE
ncbi:MAG: S8 family serine peptidase [Desulfobacteraceae bacterium]|nr:S8 family serine peptidase [Desulfobacteraceae bacterium]